MQKPKELAAINACSKKWHFLLLSARFRERSPGR